MNLDKIMSFILLLLSLSCTNYLNDQYSEPEACFDYEQEDICNFNARVGNWENNYNNHDCANNTRESRHDLFLYEITLPYNTEKFKVSWCMNYQSCTKACESCESICDDPILECKGTDWLHTDIQELKLMSYFADDYFICGVGRYYTRVNPLANLTIEHITIYAKNNAGIEINSEVITDLDITNIYEN